MTREIDLDTTPVEIPMPTKVTTVRPSAAQVWSAAIQNVAVIGAVFGFVYLGKIDGTVGAVIITAVSGLDLAKVKNLHKGPLVHTLGATGAAQWLLRVG